MRDKRNQERGTASRERPEEKQKCRDWRRNLRIVSAERPAHWARRVCRLPFRLISGGRPFFQTIFSMTHDELEERGGGLSGLCGGDHRSISSSRDTVNFIQGSLLSSVQSSQSPRCLIYLTILFLPKCLIELGLISLPALLGRRVLSKTATKIACVSDVNRIDCVIPRSRNHATYPNDI